MAKTKIEWCEETWNPITGCLHNCPYCYAKKISIRFGQKCNLINDVCNNVIDTKPENPFPYSFQPTFHKYRLNYPSALKSSKTIFVCSMSDMFGEWIPDEWIIEIFDACKKAHQHNYIFLTKNPKRYEILAQKGFLPKLHNFWYGSTVNREKDEFFASNEYNTFLSVEPIMSDFSDKFDLTNIDWVIIGAETGNRKGKVLPQKEWIVNLLKITDKYGIPVFLKNSLDDYVTTLLRDLQQYPSQLLIK